MSPDMRLKIADLVKRLRSRAYENRHHRKYREEAARMLLELEALIVEMQSIHSLELAKTYERGATAERCFPRTN